MFKVVLLVATLLPTSIVNAQFFDNCTQDCSGHHAGYEWAMRKGLTDERQCYGGKSNSFIEGCIQYVRENN